MDLNELKKLINEEVKRTRHKNLLKEQEETFFISPDAANVLKSLMINRELLSQEDDTPTWTKQATDEFINKINTAKKVYQNFKNYQNAIQFLNDYYIMIDENPQEFSLKQVHEKLKQDPNIMKSIISIFKEVNLSDTFIEAFVNNVKNDLQKFNVEQPTTNPGTPAAKLEKNPQISPTAKTKPPSSNRPGSTQATWDRVRGKKIK